MVHHIPKATLMSVLHSKRVIKEYMGEVFKWVIASNIRQWELHYFALKSYSVRQAFSTYMPN